MFIDIHGCNHAQSLFAFKLELKYIFSNQYNRDIGAIYRDISSANIDLIKNQSAA